MSLNKFSRLGDAFIIVLGLFLGPRGWILAVCVFGIECLTGLRRRLPRLTSDPDTVRRIFVACLLVEMVLVCGILGFWRDAGVWVFTAGSLANLLVITANGMRMPARGPTEHHPFYIGICPEVRLWWLGDIFAVPESDGVWFASIGDYVIVAGIWIFAGQLLARLV